MTFAAFESKFNKNNRFKKYWNYGLCYLAMGSGLFMLVMLLTGKLIKSPATPILLYIMFACITMIGLYGLFVLRKKYTLTIWENKLTKDKNIALLKFTVNSLAKSTKDMSDNFAHFSYRKDWWSLSHEIYLFADDNMIALSVESQDNNGGFIAFGASNRLRKKVMRMLEDKANKYNN